jgi:hypothetical protein
MGKHACDDGVGRGAFHALLARVNMPSELPECPVEAQNDPFNPHNFPFLPFQKASLHSRYQNKLLPSSPDEIGRNQDNAWVGPFPF